MNEMNEKSCRSICDVIDHIWKIHHSSKQSRYVLWCHHYYFSQHFLIDFNHSCQLTQHFDLQSFERLIRCHNILPNNCGVNMTQWITNQISKQTVTLFLPFCLEGHRDWNNMKKSRITVYSAIQQYLIQLLLLFRKPYYVLGKASNVCLRQPGPLDLIRLRRCNQGIISRSNDVYPWVKSQACKANHPPPSLRASEAKTHQSKHPCESSHCSPQLCHFHNTPPTTTTWALCNSAAAFHPGQSSQWLVTI